MASRKPSDKPAAKPSRAGSTRPGTRPAGTATARPAGATATGTRRPPNRKPNRSIVNQKQTPWGLIAVTAVIVVFAIAIVIYAVTSGGGNSPKGAAGSMAATTGEGRYELPELPAAAAIKGVVYHVEKNHGHVTGTVNYDTSPPTGGDHSPFWANCNGIVYPSQIANENAVHMLEHGAVWITYNPDTIKPGDLKILKNDVAGIYGLALSPYAGLKTPISLQSWGYQLFVQRASDPRIEKFIQVLKVNPATTPEQATSCNNPYFKASKSTPGHPQESQ